MQAQRSKTIKRVSTSRGGPKIAHLFFTNDNFFFYDHSTIWESIEFFFASLFWLQYINFLFLITVVTLLILWCLTIWCYCDLCGQKLGTVNWPKCSYSSLDSFPLFFSKFLYTCSARVQVWRICIKGKEMEKGSELWSSNWICWLCL